MKELLPPKIAGYGAKRDMVCLKCKHIAFEHWLGNLQRLVRPWICGKQAVLRKLVS